MAAADPGRTRHGTIPTVSFSETRRDGACPQRHTLTRTWTAADGCGNSNSCTQTITVLGCEPFAANLINHWKLDETNGNTARDSVGSNDGNLINGPLHTAGIFGEALSLDGLDDCIEVPHSASLNLSNNFSISFWFRPAQTFDATSGRRELLNKHLSSCVALNAATNDGRLVFASHAPVGLAVTVDREAGQATLNWISVAGVRYRVEYKSDLGASQWTALPGEVLATGTLASKEDALGGQQRRFYRVVTSP